MGLQSHLNKITEGLKDLDKPAGRRALPLSTASVPATTSLAHFSEEMAALKRSHGRAIRVPMDLCDDGPHHTSPLEPARVEGLKNNLEHNPQSTPALLRPKEGGRFEIIAGRHRKAALQALGHAEWDAVIRELDDDAAERLTFYDNLLAPSLTDYARYLGFARRKATRGFTVEQLALEAGVPRTTVQRLLAYGSLPPEALAHVERNPAAAGSRLAQDLAPLVAKYRARVIEAVGLVVDGKLNGNRAPAWVTDSQRSVAKAVETVIKQGRANYAKVARTAGRLVISLSDPAQTEAVEKEVAEALKRLAAAAKNAGS